MIEVVHYEAGSGADVYQEWLDGLRDRGTRVRITRRVDRIEQGNFGNHKFERDGIWALRLDFGPGYRVYYSRTGEAVKYLQDFNRRNR